jgi:ketosteroid isomerase-like protein
LRRSFSPQKESTPLDGARPPATGRYVTVWRKDGAGHWKGLIDIGTTDMR